MTNQPLTLAEKLIFRNVKKAAIVWLLIIRLDPQPVNETDAADILAIDKETARKYLRTLQECEIITRLGRFEGYTLTDGGRQLTLPFHLQQLKPEETNAGIPRSMCNEDTKIQETNAEIPRSMCIFDTSNAEIPRSERLFKEEEEEAQKKIKKSSSSLEDKQHILKQTELLFENAVVTWGIDLDQNSSPDILGWLAEAYDRRKRLDSPPSLVYSRLKDSAPARDRYRSQPGKYLPAEFLTAIDRIDLIPVCPYCAQYPCACPAEPASHAEIPELIPEEPNARIHARWTSSSLTPARAFEATLEQLRSEMPKAAFENWLQDTRLLDADPEKMEFTIGAGNDYAVEWIESRLSSTMTRLLTGSMNATLNIQIRKIEYKPMEEEPDANHP